MFILVFVGQIHFKRNIVDRLDVEKTLNAALCVIFMPILSMSKFSLHVRHRQESLCLFALSLQQSKWFR